MVTIIRSSITFKVWSFKEKWRHVDVPDDVHTVWISELVSTHSPSYKRFSRPGKVLRELQPPGFDFFRCFAFQIKAFKHCSKLGFFFQSFYLYLKRRHVMAIDTNSTEELKNMVLLRNKLISILKYPFFRFCKYLLTYRRILILKYTNTFNVIKHK